MRHGSSLWMVESSGRVSAITDTVTTMTSARSYFFVALAGVLFAIGAATGCRDTHAGQSGSAASGEAKPPAELRLDWATYNISSVVLKRNGWLEQELARDGIAVRWIESQGSNKANELRSEEHTAELQ